MAWPQPELDEDDAARVEKAQIAAFKIHVQRLVDLKLPEKSSDARVIEGLDTLICVLGRMPTDFQVQQIKELSWKYRRQMPRELAPKLPPHDPIVRAMEGWR